MLSACKATGAGSPCPLAAVLASREHAAHGRMRLQVQARLESLVSVDVPLQILFGVQRVVDGSPPSAPVRQPLRWEQLEPGGSCRGR